MTLSYSGIVTLYFSRFLISSKTSKQSKVKLLLSSFKEFANPYVLQFEISNHFSKEHSLQSDCYTTLYSIVRNGSVAYKTCRNSRKTRKSSVNLRR